jgi:hypothetical protein
MMENGPIAGVHEREVVRQPRKEASGSSRRDNGYRSSQHC